MRAFQVLIVGASLLASQVAFAQRSAEDIDADIAGTINSQPLETFIAQFLQPIRGSGDRRALTKAEVEAAERLQMVQRRATLIGQMLRYDLDGDGAVTLQEIEEGTQVRRASRLLTARPGLPEDQARSRAASEFQQYAPADADKDGRVTVAEMLASDHFGRQRIERRQASAGLLLELDADGDGKVTTAEAESRARAVFARYDKDGDGLVDDGAIAALNRQAQARREARELEEIAARCVMPKPADNELVVLFQAAGGQAVSTLALGSQNETTQVVSVTIEQGDKPIYLVLGSNRNVIWQVNGAANRVSRVVLLASAQGRPGSGAGMTGIGASKVTFSERMACLGRPDGTETGERAAAMFERIIGRSYDVSASSRDTIIGVSIPSLATEGTSLRETRRTDPACWAALRSIGTIANGVPPSDGTCNWLQAEQKLLYPGGLKWIGAANIVASRSAAQYDVLPSPFGYVAAIDDGTLQDISGGEKRQFRIVKPFKRFPATELAARALSFRLTDGVQMPDGAGHATCVLDPNGKLVAGRPERCGQMQ